MTLELVREPDEVTLRASIDEAVEAERLLAERLEEIALDVPLDVVGLVAAASLHRQQRRHARGLRALWKAEHS